MILISVGFTLLLAFGLIPIHSSEWSIQFDQQAIEKKTSFLQAIPQTLPSKKKPNIVILMADDLGYFDISLHGNPHIQTKYIDALANDGINCTRAYATAPSCSPSRAGFITGRYQHRFGFENQIHERLPRNRLELWWARNLLDSYPWKIKQLATVPREEDRLREGLPPTEITLAEILKKFGYRTGIFGKWHLGSTEHALPHKRGFDQHFGFYASHSLFAPEGMSGMVDMHNGKDWTDDHIWSGQRNGDCAIVRNGQVVADSSYLTQKLADEAIEFIDSNQDQAFFLLVSFNAPHTPFQAPKAYYDQFSHIQDPLQRIYLSMIASLDDAVGSIHHKLKTLGLEEDTLIFFLSDNGGAEYTHATSNAPLKGGKITSFDGGLRIPFFIKWKEVLPEGLTFDPMISTLDIFSTICAAANIPLPHDRKYDGVNLLPYWLGEESNLPHKSLFWKGGSAKGIVQGDWKLLFNEDMESSRLYHISEDPFEQKDLRNQFPKLVQELKLAHKTWYSEMPGPMWPALVSFAHEDEAGTFYFDN